MSGSRALREARRPPRRLQGAAIPQARTKAVRALVKCMKQHPFSSARVLWESTGRLSMAALALRHAAL
jgi:hypothetical protein